MLKIRVVCVGRLKEKYFSDACAEYLKRMQRFAKVTVDELPEKRTPEEEAESVLRHIRGRAFVLSPEGEKFSSEEFAAEIGRCADRGDEITFVIGSSCGLSKRVKERADRLVSFSDMTFPHQLMRVILLEQVYRAFMINAGSEYHK